MPRIQFGTFLAPHHPSGENPTLLFQRDLELAAHLDRLGFDEFWCGEHHSSGWEMIASPEMFLAAAGQRTHTHHARHRRRQPAVPPPVQRRPAHGAARPHDERPGDVRFGPRRAARPTPARSASIPMVQRDRQDEAIGVIIRLLRGEERFSYDSEWFELHEAKLQILPVQERHADGDGVVDLAVGHAARRQVRHGRAVDRLQLHRGDPGAADAVGLRRGRRGEARPDGRPEELARDDGVPPRRVTRAGAQRGRRRAAALAQRVQRVDARAPERHRRRRHVGAARADHR